MGDSSTAKLLRGLDRTDSLADQLAHIDIARNLFGCTVPPPACGRYRITARIGAGTGGTVYRAWDPLLQRFVALKVFHRTFDDRQLLREEARVIGELEHPNLVKVFDIAAADANDHRFYFVMELVDGTSADVWLSDPNVTAQDVLAMFVGAAAGLAHAHARGVLHRDLKPANILVDAQGRGLVCDFGLALRQRDEASGHRRDWVGTPRYMAPEQRIGGTVDARADQYSFSIALREALLQWGRAEQLDHATWTRVDAVTRRGLAHDPAARWPSMNDLLAALHDRRRGDWVWWTVLPAALVLGLWFVASAFVGKPCEPLPDIEIARGGAYEVALTAHRTRLERVAAEVCRASEATPEQTRCVRRNALGLESVASALAMSDRSWPARDLVAELGEPEQCLSSAPAEPVMVVPSEPDGQRLWLAIRSGRGDYDAMTKAAEQHGWHHLAALARLEHGRRLRTEGRFVEASAVLEKGFEQAQSLDDVPIASSAALTLSMVSAALDDKRASLRWVEIGKALAARSRAEGLQMEASIIDALAEREGWSAVRAADRIGTILAATGSDPRLGSEAHIRWQLLHAELLIQAGLHIRQALAVLDATIPRIRQELDAEPHLLSHAEVRRAIALHYLREPELAAQSLATALARFERLDQLDLVAAIDARLLESVLFRSRGDFDAALHAIARAEQAIAAAQGPEAPDMARVHQARGTVHEEIRRDPGAARDAFARARAIAEVAFGPRSPRTIDAISGLTRVAIWMGNDEEAAALATEGLERAGSGSDAFGWLYLRGLRGAAYAELGRLEEAREDLEYTIDQSERSDQSYGVPPHLLHLILGTVLRDLGEAEGAERAFLDSVRHAPAHDRYDGSTRARAAWRLVLVYERDDIEEARRWARWGIGQRVYRGAKANDPVFARLDTWLKRRDASVRTKGGFR